MKMRVAKEHIMLRNVMIIATAAALSIGFVATGGFARGGGGGGHGGNLSGGFGAARPGAGFSGTQGLGGAPGELLIKPVAPQFNDPGPQLALPRPGNSVQQLSPLGSAGQPDSLGIK
jgi:hypothetical protein